MDAFMRCLRSMDMDVWSMDMDMESNFGAPAIDLSVW